MHQKRLVTTLFVGMLVLAAGVATPVAAQDSGILDDFQSEEESSTAGMALAAIDGITDRVSYWAGGINPLADDPDPETAVSNDAAELRSVVTNNSSVIEAYANDRFAGNASEWNVIEITHERDEATTTHYLVADVNASTGDFENVSMAASTNRTVDQSLVLEDYLSDQAAAEMSHFIENYAAEDKDITGEYISRLGSKYKGHYELPDAANGGD